MAKHLPNSPKKMEKDTFLQKSLFQKNKPLSGTKHTCANLSV